MTKIYTDVELKYLRERTARAEAKRREDKINFDREHERLLALIVAPAKARLDKEIATLRTECKKSFDEHQLLSQELAQATRAREAHDRQQRVINHPLLGKRVHRWDRRYRHHPWSVVDGAGSSGVVEIFREGDPEMQNRRWSRPAPGTLIIRILKADGTPAKQTITMAAGELPWGWFEEGVDPNKIEEKKS